MFQTLNEYRVPADPDGSDADVMAFGEPRDPRSIHLVAECDGIVVGSVMVEPLDGASGKLSKLFVQRQYRRRGIGRALSDQALEAARGGGYGRLEINTRALYREAVAFYESSGWVRGPDKLGPGPTRVYFLLLDEQAPD